MRLYHSTPDRNKAGIELEGFKDTPESGQDPESKGHTWFSLCRDTENTANKDRDWWVIVDVPDEVFEEHRYRTDGRPDRFMTRLPHGVANLCRPFTYERIT